MSEPQFLFFDELPSTNQKLKELAEAGGLPELSVLLTQHQTAGRGQMGNSWESEAGKNLTFSVLLKPDFLKIQSQFQLSQAVSVAIAETLSGLGIDDVKVKWPNDIYVGSKKIAGILIENSIMRAFIEQSIVGIGLNVNQTQFLSNAPNPVSMAQLQNKTFDLQQLLDLLLQNLFGNYAMLVNDAQLVGQQYRSLLFWGDGLMHDFRDQNGSFRAAIDGTDEYGRLKLRAEDGALRIYEFKEVSYLIGNEERH